MSSVTIGIIDIVITFLVNPFGLPMLTVWLLGLLQRLHYGCIIDKTGNHPKIINKEKQMVYSIPIHGKTVMQAYVKGVNDLLNLNWPLEEEKEEN